ncbi:MAG: hypothetical protein HC781_18270, partial [Leptolyngbyaceae cyanobacterium CSU_1_4]|nr:hypothetical protein [Leptolyngbyaceae cyanobacterium CSU_1_4]
LHVPSENWVIVSLLLSGGVLSVVMWGWNGQQQLFGLLVLCLGWGSICLVLLGRNYWVPFASPLLLGITTTVALQVKQRLREEKLFQQEVERLWNTYRQDLVVQKRSYTTVPTQIAGLLQSGMALRITQLSALAEQFGRSQSTQAAISRSLSIGLLAADLEGWVWFCNPIAAECLGVQVGDRLQYCLIPEWFTLEQWQTGLERLLQQIPFVSHELQRDDRWFEIRLEPLLTPPALIPDPLSRSAHGDDGLSASLDRWGDGTPQGLLLLLENVTARKQVEDNLVKQMEELQIINELKDDFLNTIRTICARL